MTGTDRSEALEWAGVSREARFRLREQIQNSELTLVEVLDNARTDPLTGQVKLLWTLESLPGARKVLTRRRLSALGLEESARIGALSDQQVELVMANFGAVDGGEPGGSD